MMLKIFGRSNFRKKFVTIQQFERTGYRKSKTNIFCHDVCFDIRSKCGLGWSWTL